MLTFITSPSSSISWAEDGGSNEKQVITLSREIKGKREGGREIDGAGIYNLTIHLETFS